MIGLILLKLYAQYFEMPPFSSVLMNLSFQDLRFYISFIKPKWNYSIPGPNPVSKCPIYITCVFVFDIFLFKPEKQDPETLNIMLRTGLVFPPPPLYYLSI